MNQNKEIVINLSLRLNRGTLRRALVFSIVTTGLVVPAWIFASQVGSLTSFTSGTPIVAAEVNGNFSAIRTSVNDNDARIAALEAAVVVIQDNSVMDGDGILTFDSDGNGNARALFEGVNVQVVNGVRQTVANSLGNLIVGYNANYSGTKGFCSDGRYTFADCATNGGTWASVHKTGSHNIVGGNGPNYSSVGGLVVGTDNTINGMYASVTGGNDNAASGQRSSISGGEDNDARGDWSTISGGQWNSAEGDHGSVSGGGQNVASGAHSSVFGGSVNEASGSYSVAVGGNDNTASGPFSATVGGEDNYAANGFTVTTGGSNNSSNYLHSAIFGGMDNSASQDHSVILGGHTNLTTGLFSVVSGGSFNTASGDQSAVSGGSHNTAAGSGSSVNGGQINTADGVSTTILGGQGNVRPFGSLFDTVVGDANRVYVDTTLIH